jgi:hypothetical protein
VAYLRIRGSRMDAAATGCDDAAVVIILASV